jgi:hypothetical protein
LLLVDYDVLAFVLSAAAGCYSLCLIETSRLGILKFRTRGYYFSSRFYLHEFIGRPESSVTVLLTATFRCPKEIPPI